MPESSIFEAQGHWYRRGPVILVEDGLWDEAEHEVSRNVSARVSWKGPLNITQAQKEKGGGLYFIRANDNPCYVGQTVSFADRLAAHLRSGRCTYAPPHLWTIWIGRVQSSRAGAPANSDAERRLRLGVEHAVIRSVINQQRLGGKGTLLNKTSIRPFRVDGLLRVENIGDIPRVGSSTRGKSLGVRRAQIGGKGSWRTLIKDKDGSLFEWRP